MLHKEQKKEEEKPKGRSAPLIPKNPGDRWKIPPQYEVLALELCWKCHCGEVVVLHCSTPPSHHFIRLLRQGV